MATCPRGCPSRRSVEVVDHHPEYPDACNDLPIDGLTLGYQSHDGHEAERRADHRAPKWGIQRSLGDTSGSLQNWPLLLTDLRACKPVEATGTRLEAENATISQGAVESDRAGYSGTGFVNTATTAGGCPNFDYVEILA
ncbi:hypothetical protein [Nonomuraea roseola]|uniref:Uncharacterized protein n=1 Tax=Nonomuraea roseola TaxID=46179 RepID=A0ABV5QC13_9ACTN